MLRRPNPDSEANIRRIDTKARAKKQTHGFQVHFLRGCVVTRMFSDSPHGGKQGPTQRGNSNIGHSPLLRRRLAGLR
jgi:hypothetical protein